MSTQQEVALGQAYSDTVNSQLPIVQDPEVARYLNVLGDSIAGLTSRGDLNWHFYLVNSDVVNAFALPGGFVYINRGIVEHATQMNELAGVMAHEIGHVVERHSVKQMSQMQGANIGVALACVLTSVCNSQLGQAAIQVGGTLVFAKFSREDEMQADEDAVPELVRAGINPEGLVTMFQKLLSMEQGQAQPPAWLSDHPLTQDRISDVQAIIAKTVPPEVLRTLTTDTRAFHDFKNRVAQLPPPPPQQQQSQ